MLTKSPALRQAVLRVSRPNALGARGVHVDNVVYNNMPFQYRNKGAFAVKLGLFLASGFSIPFLATWWQLKKKAA